MAATFDNALTTARDRLRLRLGDVETEHALLDDATYDGAVDEYGENGAAAFLASSLVAQYGQYPVTTDENGVTLDFSERLKAWQWVAAQAGSAPPTALGSSAATVSVTLPTRASRSGAVDEYGRPVRYV